MPDRIPENLLDDDLSDLSKEPLLLYFLAFAEIWKKGPVDVGSRNGVYDQVLRKFHGRECQKQHSNLAKAFRDFDEGYEPVMQALALSAWYDGTTRKGNIDDVRKILADTSLRADFDMTVGQKAAFGVSLAFHLRPVDGNKTFEFLHKTFAEYLVARRFVDDMSAVVDDRKAIGPRSRTRGDVSSTLRRWLATWGARAIDGDVLRFIRDEVARRARNYDSDKPFAYAGAIDTFSELMRRAIAEGMPAHEMKGEERARRKVETFSDMTDWARSAEEALLVALNAVIVSNAGSTAEQGAAVVSINPTPENRIVMGDMMHRLGRQPGQGFVWTSCLSGLDVSGADLTGANLTEADLTAADLTESNLGGADLWGADLTGANLGGANLYRADLTGANLTGADLTGADLYRADFTEADLTAADFSGASLIGSDLSGANLTGANLIGSDLSGANLTAANLIESDLSGNSFLAEVRGLRQVRHIDAATLPEGWSVAWNEADKAWDIVTPNGPYVDPEDRAPRS